MGLSAFGKSLAVGDGAGGGICAGILPIVVRRHLGWVGFQRLQPVEPLDGEGGDAFAASLVALDADEVVHLDYLALYLLAAVDGVDHFEPGVEVEAEVDEGASVVVEEWLFAVGGLGDEPFEIGVAHGTRRGNGRPR